MPLEVAAAWIISGALVLTLLVGVVVTGTVLSSRMNPEALRVVRYIFVGAVATGSYFFSALALNSFGWEPVVAATTAQIISTAISYLGHHTVTFERASSHKSAAPRFLVAAAVAFFVNTLSTYLFAHVLRASDFVTVTASTIAVAVGGYLLMRLWVFARP